MQCTNKLNIKNFKNVDKASVKKFDSTLNY